MPTILEDEDLIAQAQERERARLEEEAAILAYQQQQQAALPPPVWAGSPEVVIDEFNAQPGMVGAPTTIGSEQYNQELARAQRGSGFIAPNVSPTGEVISAGYDPALDPRVIAAQREAVNFQRQQLYGQLLRDGATAAEAFRFANSRYPDIKSAPALSRMDALAASRKPLQPEVRVVDGVRMMRSGPNSWARVPEPRASASRLVAPPQIKVQDENLKGQLSSLRRALVAEQGKTVADDTKIAALTQQIAGLEKARVDLVAPGGVPIPEMNQNVDQRSFSQMRPAWEAAGRAPVVMPQAATLAAAPVSETVTITTKEDFDKLPSGATYTGKDGRKYRKP
jgi:hypothetical protein